MASADASAPPKLLRSKLFWVALLYFSEGFPLGVFYELFPVYFRQQGVELKDIGLISLLGLAWTVKFLWAPAIDHYRRHRVWMATVDVAMALVLIAFAASKGFGPWVWAAIGAFTLLSATNDIAIDGYTIELLDRNELGLANGIRIGFYRVGMLASGLVLILSDWLTWSGAFAGGAAILAACAAAVLAAPRERVVVRDEQLGLRAEFARVLADPRGAVPVAALALGTLWLVDNALGLSAARPALWPVAWAAAAAGIAVSAALHAARTRRRTAAGTPPATARGPMFGALLELLGRPHIVPVLLFVLIFKLGDASMGFMVKPFWVDAQFSATEIGLVSVNIGLGLSIAGGLAGGWYTDRAGIFRALWVLGLFQAISNLGYAIAASVIPYGAPGELELWHRAVMYSASAAESFTGGLGTAAFLAFLMAIVDKRHSATEYALLSSVFALSRSLAGWASGYGAQELGYAQYFLLTFFLSFPAYAALPWVRRMLDFVEARNRSVAEEQSPARA
ncbi:MAG: MFS transporter [Burkholderiales bacterium]|nr:MFS transporter [Burkholderiales bacterium]